MVDRALLLRKIGELEICVDVANHICSDRGMRTPVSYADTFKVLEENGAIDAGLFSNMDRMAEFRNVVVHQYDVVNAQIVMAILRKHLGDFERFRQAILDYLRNEKS